jgi:hypothetical protein
LDFNKLWTHMKANWVVTIVTAILAIVGLTVSLNVTTEPTPTGGTHKSFTLHVDKSGQPGVQTGTYQVPASVQAAIKPNLETNLRGETPAGMTQAQIDAAAKAAEGIKTTLPGLPTAGATAEVPGCRTEFIHSYSSRHGVRPTIFTLHLTVSHNVRGWGDVNAIVNLFAHEEASSNFVLDGEGHCAYIVPIEQKAWTQAGGNPFSISVEVIDYGNESVYLAPPGMKQLRVIARWVNKHAGIPIRLGKVSGSCTPIRSGFVQHFDWGVCGGGHVDIRPFPVPQIVAYLAAGSKPSKKSAWIKHRVADHHLYVRYCTTKTQRRHRPKQCAQIRAHARKLDKLIARKRG